MTPELHDAAARETAVTDFERDLLVEAGAGSGKTSLLVERLLQALLVLGEELQGIAAITFTKKAAAEMQNRLAEDLERVVALGAGTEATSAGNAAGRLWLRLEGQEEARRLAAERAEARLAHLDEAVITTMHAFCGGLLRRHPLASGLAPGFGQDEGVAMETLLEEQGPAVVGRVLAGLAEPDRAALGRHAGEELVWAAGQAATQSPAPEPEPETDPMAPLARLARRSSDALRGLHHEEGWVSFEDSLRLTRNLLEQNAPVRRAEQHRLRHLLVDELQDTDPNQYRILRSLALDARPGEPRPRLFLVGDPKQSIYRFRRADLGAYERFCKEVAAGGERLVLTTNFRSRSRLLEPVNRLFSKVMAAERGVQPRYEPIQPAPGLEDEAGAPPRVELIELRAPEDANWKVDKAREAEAAVIVEQLSARQAAGMRWKQMLVLMPRLTGLEIVQRAFQEAGIPFTVEGGKSFYKRQEVADFAALLTALLDRDEASEAYPAALLALMRSCVGGVSDTELFRYRGAIGDKVPFGTPPPTGSCPAVERVLARLQGWREALRGVPVDEVPARILDCSGLRAAWGIRPLGSQAVANLDKAAEALADRMRAHGASLSEAAAHLADRLGQGEESDQGVSEENADAVGILTVHKAKGLERELVVLCGLKGGESFDPAGRKLLADEERGYGFKFSSEDSSPLYDLLYAEDRAHLEAEKLRLLYVALTRARSELLIVQSLALPEKKPEGLFEKNAWMRALREGWGYVPREAPPEVDGVRFTHRDAFPEVQRARSLDASGVERAAAAVKEWAEWLPEASPRHGTPSGLPHEQAAAGEEEVRGGADEADTGDLPRARGILVHRLLERWDFRDFASLYAPLGEMAETIAAEESVDAGALEKRARLLLGKLGESDCGPHLLALAAAERHAELPILHEEKGVLHYGFIDLLYRQPGGEWVVADYKTDTGLEPQAACVRYGETMRLYGNAVQQALDLPRPPRLELLLLDTGKIATVSSESKVEA